MFRLTTRCHKHVFDPWQRREQPAHINLLKFRQDSFGAGAPPVINEVAGIPSGPVRTLCCAKTSSVFLDSHQHMKDILLGIDISRYWAMVGATF